MILRAENDWGKPKGQLQEKTLPNRGTPNLPGMYVANGLQECWVLRLWMHQSFEWYVLGFAVGVLNSRKCQESTEWIVTGSKEHDIRRLTKCMARCINQVSFT